MKDLKAFLNWAVDKKHITNLDFKRFKVLREDKEVIYLTSDELYKLVDYKPDTHFLEKVKDLFWLFYWFTCNRLEENC